MNCLDFFTALLVVQMKMDWTRAFPLCSVCITLCILSLAWWFMPDDSALLLNEAITICFETQNLTWIYKHFGNISSGRTWWICKSISVQRMSFPLSPPGDLLASKWITSLLKPTYTLQYLSHNAWKIGPTAWHMKLHAPLCQKAAWACERTERCSAKGHVQSGREKQKNKSILTGFKAKIQIYQCSRFTPCLALLI